MVMDDRAHGAYSRWEIDACARLALCHRIELSLVARAIGIDDAAAARMLAGEPIALDAERRERLSLLLNILIRAEIRFRGDSRLITELMTTPVAELGNMAPAAKMIDIGGLRAVRSAIDTIPVPVVRMWRCPSGYG